MDQNGFVVPWEQVLFYCNRKSSELLEPSTIGGESAMFMKKQILHTKNYQTNFKLVLEIMLELLD